jgi:hypothetical protein
MAVTEYYHLLGCNVVFFGISVSKGFAATIFMKDMQAAVSSQTSVPIYQTIMCHRRVLFLK